MKKIITECWINGVAYKTPNIEVEDRDILTFQEGRGLTVSKASASPDCTVSIVRDGIPSEPAF